MSWDESRYTATCSSCGHEGVEVSRSDDWGNSETRWEGFATVPASDYEYYRGRSEARVPECKCGSKSILRGKVLPK